MSVRRLRTSAAPLVQSIGATGTTTLDWSLPAGLYRIATDTTQSLSAVQLTFNSSGGYAFGAVIRGGLGYVALPSDVTSVTLTSGTFPLVLEIEVLTYSLIDAPTNLTWTYAGPSSNQASLAFTLPAGATGIGLYYTNGTFVDLSTTTSPKTGITLPSVPSLGQTFPALAVAKDANGVFGLSASPTGAYPFATFNTSGTYTPPTGSTNAEVWIVGGGGGGGGAGPRHGGGGGAGAYITTTVATNAPVSVIVGSGGTAGTTFNTSTRGTDGGTGGSSSFGNVTANGGGFGGRSEGAGGSGGCGGGAGGIAGAGTGGAGNVGFAGGASQYDAGGGGGGMGSAGGAATFNAGNGAAPGAGGNGVTVNAISQNFSSGGGGGVVTNSSITGSTANTAGSGGGGGAKLSNSNLSQPAAGRAGTVVVRAIGI